MRFTQIINAPINYLILAGLIVNHMQHILVQVRGAGPPQHFMDWQADLSPQSRRLHRESQVVCHSQRQCITGKRFSAILGLVHSRGFLEVVAGPWCLDMRVAESTNNTADIDRADMFGKVVPPGPEMVIEWATVARMYGWTDGGWSPARSLAVEWPDGDVRSYKAEVATSEYDLQLVWGHCMRTAVADFGVMAAAHKRYMILCRRLREEERQEDARRSRPRKLSLKYMFQRQRRFRLFMLQEQRNYEQASAACREWCEYRLLYC
jgi:hypothetical protein